MDYLTAKQIKETFGITSQTLYNWRKSGAIKYIKLPSGSFIYLSPIEEIEKPKNHVIYARVSNTKQKEDLDRQIATLSAFIAVKGNQVNQIFSDIASGMNEDRKAFNQLMTQVLDGKIDTIYVTYKDRLTRFGFGYFEKICSKFNTQIVVLNETQTQNFQDELIQDLVSIIHHFSMKLYSNRRKQLKEFKKILQNEDNQTPLYHR